MSLPAAPLPDRLPPELLGDAALGALVAVLDGAAGQTRLVGGAVRDALLGLAINDIDLATLLLPHEALRRAEAAGFKVIPTGLAHGTITVIARGRAFEITTLRRDVATDGRRATIAYSDRWDEDAARRDFTINALYADPADGTIHDYHGGLADLAAGRVRFIGDAAARISEDHLRILRYFRFLARYGDVAAADPAILATLSAHAGSLMALSRERIWDELRKILALPDPLAVVQLMIAHGIFAPVLPEVDDAGALAMLVAAEQRHGVAADPLRRMAALIWPTARANGSMVAEALAVRLRMSRAERKRLSLAVAAHPPMSGAAELAYWIGVEPAIDHLLLAGRDPAPLLPRWERPAFPLRGGMIVRMGVAEGPAVAAILQRVEQQWVAEGFPDEARVHALVSAAISQT